MIFFVIILLYLAIGALLVAIDLNTDEGRKSFYKNLNDLMLQGNISRRVAVVVMLCGAVLLWPLAVKSIRF